MKHYLNRFSNLYYHLSVDELLIDQENGYAKSHGRMRTINIVSLQGIKITLMNMTMTIGNVRFHYWNCTLFEKEYTYLSYRLKTYSYVVRMIKIDLSSM